MLQGVSRQLKILEQCCQKGPHYVHGCVAKLALLCGQAVPTMAQQVLGEEGEKVDRYSTRQYHCQVLHIYLLKYNTPCKHTPTHSPPPSTYLHCFL